MIKAVVKVGSAVTLGARVFPGKVSPLEVVLAGAEDPRSQRSSPLGPLVTSLDVHLVRVFFQVGQLSPDPPVQDTQVGQPYGHVLYELL